VLVADTRLGHAFSNNGDGSFFSGAYTSRGYGTRAGLWVETELSAPITATESQEQVLSLFAMVDSTTWANWDHVTGDGPMGVTSPSWSFRYPYGAHAAHLGEEFLITANSGALLLRAPADASTGRPFRVVLQIFPDGHRGLALNGKPVWIGSADFFQPEVHLMLAGNSVNTKILVGHLRIVAGIATDIDWESR
jgi:hypothetical protein